MGGRNSLDPEEKLKPSTPIQASGEKGLTLTFDFKFNNTKTEFRTTILELGDGICSYYSGYAISHGEDLYHKIIDALREQFDHIFLLKTRVRSIYGARSLCKEDYLKSHSACLAFDSITELVAHYRGSESCQKERCVAIGLSMGDNLHIGYYFSKHKVPITVWSDHPLIHYCTADKLLFYALCNENSLLKPYIPLTFLVSANSKIEEILSKIKTSHVILKPPNSTMGKGVTVIAKKDLKTVFHLIFSNSSKKLTGYPAETSKEFDSLRSFSQRPETRIFVVQELCESIPQHQGYDYVGRAVFNISYEDHPSTKPGAPKKIELIGAYAKLPKAKKINNTPSNLDVISGVNEDEKSENSPSKIPDSSLELITADLTEFIRRFIPAILPLSKANIPKVKKSHDYFTRMAEPHWLDSWEESSPKTPLDLTEAIKQLEKQMRLFNLRPFDPILLAEEIDQDLFLAVLGVLKKLNLQERTHFTTPLFSFASHWIKDGSKLKERQASYIKSFNNIPPELRPDFDYGSTRMIILHSIYVLCLEPDNVESTVSALYSEHSPVICRQIEPMPLSITTPTAPVLPENKNIQAQVQNALKEMSLIQTGDLAKDKRNQQLLFNTAIKEMSLNQLYNLLIYMGGVQTAHEKNPFSRIRKERWSLFGGGNTHTWQSMFHAAKMEFIEKYKQAPLTTISIEKAEYKKIKKVLSIHSGRWYAAWGDTYSFCFFTRTFGPAVPGKKCSPPRPEKPKRCC